MPTKKKEEKRYFLFMFERKALYYLTPRKRSSNSKNELFSKCRHVG